MNSQEKIEAAKQVFSTEIIAMEKTRDMLDENFLKILDLVVNCKGRVILTGMGKPGHITKKLAATFASLGTPSFSLHPAEALHGDLGMVTENDVVIAISYSGESDEITRILPNIKMIGATLVGITGNASSTLAKMCDVVQVFPKFEEACHMHLAPTSSTTVTLAYGDALAVVASRIYGFNEQNFGMFHPAGSLGKKLVIKVKDLMAVEADNATIDVEARLHDAIIELSKKGLGIVAVLNADGSMAGVITDGDLRRLLEKKVDVYTLKVKDVMTKEPQLIEKSAFAIDALKKMKDSKVSSLPVLDEDDKVVGIITLQQVINAGIVI